VKVCLLADFVAFPLVKTVPPDVEEGDLGVHELHGGKLLQLDQHVVQDVLHLLLVVAVVRLYPACNVRSSVRISL